MRGGKKKKKNFYIGNNFSWVRVRAFIFHMSIFCDETFLLVQVQRHQSRSRPVFKIIHKRNVKPLIQLLNGEWKQLSYSTCIFPGIVKIPFFGTKVKTICQGQGQGQISVSQCSNKWLLRGHLCFTNTSFFVAASNHFQSGPTFHYA